MGLMTSEVQAGQAESVTSRTNTKLPLNQTPSYLFCVSFTLFTFLYKKDLVT